MKKGELFTALKDALSGYHVKSVAEIAGVHHSTVYNWLEGKTEHPRIDTIEKVAGAIGFEVDLKMVRKAHLRRAG